MMSSYMRRTEYVFAEQWDGKRDSAYKLIGYVFSNGAQAGIEDGYPSQGPDLITVETVDGTRRMFPGMWLVMERHARFRLFDDDAFTQQFELYDPEPGRPEVITLEGNGEMQLTPRMIEHLRVKPGDWLRLVVREDGSMLLGPAASDDEVAQWKRQQQQQEETDEQPPSAEEEGVRG